MDVLAQSLEESKKRRGAGDEKRRPRRSAARRRQPRGPNPGRSSPCSASRGQHSPWPRRRLARASSSRRARCAGHRQRDRGERERLDARVSASRSAPSRPVETGGARIPESESSDELVPSTVPCSRSDAALLISAVMPVFVSAMPNAKSSMCYREQREVVDERNQREAGDERREPDVRHRAVAEPRRDASDDDGVHEDVEDGEDRKEIIGLRERESELPRANTARRRRTSRTAPARSRASAQRSVARRGLRKLRHESRPCRRAPRP